MKEYSTLYSELGLHHWMQFCVIPKTQYFLITPGELFRKSAVNHIYSYFLNKIKTVLKVPL